MEIAYKATFIRELKKLDKDLQEEVLEKIELFKDISNHQLLKVHKLHGKFGDSYSFSVNYKFRIVFEYLSKKEVAILTVGDHEIYY